MNASGWTLAAIAAMSAVTFLCRAGGYWLFRSIKPGPNVRTVMGYIPGTLFVSYVVPALAAGGLAQWVGAAATLLLLRLAGNLGLAVVGGTAAAWAVWTML